MWDEERHALTAAARRLAALGLAPGTSGNVSVRSGERVAVSPTGAVLARMQADEVAVVDLHGAVVDGRHAPTSELALHLAVYGRSDAGAVVHAHPPAATAVAAVLDELPALHYTIVQLGGPVRVARYETFGTEALAEATVEALTGRTAVIMANHGTLSYGADLAEALARTELLEWLCDLFVRAASIGGPAAVRALDDDQLRAVADELARRRSTPFGPGALPPS